MAAISVGVNVSINRDGMGTILLPWG